MAAAFLMMVSADGARAELLPPPERVGPTGPSDDTTPTFTVTGIPGVPVYCAFAGPYQDTSLSSYTLVEDGTYTPQLPEVSGAYAIKCGQWTDPSTGWGAGIGTYLLDLTPPDQRKVPVVFGSSRHSVRLVDGELKVRSIVPIAGVSAKVSKSDCVGDVAVVISRNNTAITNGTFSLRYARGKCAVDVRLTMPKQWKGICVFAELTMSSPTLTGPTQLFPPVKQAMVRI